MSSAHQTDLAKKEAALIAVIEMVFPDFARACRADVCSVLILHQDAFAADDQEEEYQRLGIAIKFAGLCGKDVRIQRESGDS